MKIMTKKLRFILWLLTLLLAACAGLSIPAPDAPVKALPEPPVEKSVIAVPVKVPLDSILNDMGLSSGEYGMGNRIAGSIRRFLQRQALKNETRIVKTHYVRALIGKTWDSLQNPIPLQNGLSLLLNPQAVSVSVLPEQNEDLQLIVGLTAKPKLVAGTPAPGRLPLPEVSIAPAPSRTGFHIALETELPFEVLGNELTRQLAGKVFARQGESVTVQKARAYGSGESVVIAMNIKGSLNGVVYLSGIPAYDPSTRSLTLRDLDYTLETNRVLAKAADWLRHAGLRESLQKKASWYVGDRIDAAKETISLALNRTVNSQMSVTGSIDALRPVSVGITKAALKAVLEADGTADIEILR